jgi:hypothetical protein
VFELSRDTSSVLDEREEDNVSETEEKENAVFAQPEVSSYFNYSFPFIVSS